MARLERADAGVKVPCLTTWLHPNVAKKEKGLGFLPIPFSSGVDNGARTHDTRNHNPVLCQLSYIHHMLTSLILTLGAPGGTRTPGLLLRRQLLYPTELLALISLPSSGVIGAGEGNRTLVPSLEGWYSTIELHPQACK